METTIDAAGRIVVPKALRDRLGLTPGSRVDISEYGPGLAVVPSGRTARIVDEDDRLVATGSSPLGDEELFALIDTSRR